MYIWQKYLTSLKMSKFVKFTLSYVGNSMLCVTHYWQLFRLFGADTSHTAIKAIGGLNLPGGGGVAPFEENTLREVKWSSSVKKLKIPAGSFSSVTVLQFIFRCRGMSNATEIRVWKTDWLKSPLSKSLTQRSVFLKRDSILQLAASTLCLDALAASFCPIVVSRWVLDVPVSRRFRLVISLVRASHETAGFPSAAEILVLKLDKKGPSKKPPYLI